MANAQSFPLLRLPCLAREHVLKVMNVREQYLFAQLSMKSKRLTKNGVRHLPYDSDWVLESGYIWIGLQKAGTNKWLVIRILPIHDEDVADRHEIQLKMEDIFGASMKQLEFLNDVFKISNFKIETYCIPNDSTKQFLARVRELEIEIHALKVEVEKPDNEMFQWVMQNCRDVKRLTNNCETTSNFQWDSQEPFTSEYVSLRNAPWLTLDHLTSLFRNCRFFEVTLNEHDLTDYDLNQLIRIWIADSKMEFVRIRTGVATDFHSIVRGIEKVPIQRVFIKKNSRTFFPREAYKIRQKCGKEAVVCILGDAGFTITTHFDDPRCDLWDESEDEEEDESEEDEEEELEEEDGEEEEGEEEDLEEGEDDAEEEELEDEDEEEEDEMEEEEEEDN